MKFVLLVLRTVSTTPTLRKVGKPTDIFALPVAAYLKAPMVLLYGFRVDQFGGRSLACRSVLSLPADSIIEIRFDLLERLRPARYNWEDLRQLLRRSEKIDPKRLIADAKRHELKKLPGALLKEA